MYQFNWRPVFDNFDLLLKGLLLGIGIAVLALAIGSLLGLVAADLCCRGAPRRSDLAEFRQYRAARRDDRRRVRYLRSILSEILRRHAGPSAGGLSGGIRSQTLEHRHLSP